MHSQNRYFKMTVYIFLTIILRFRIPFRIPFSANCWDYLSHDNIYDKLYEAFKQFIFGSLFSAF